ncbi:MAG: MarR family EPS-associated transcriptional regulator [Porticoccaceae bacterium]
MIDDAIRLRLLRLLNDDPALSQRELAERLGLSLGKTNYCLRALIEKGWIKVSNFAHSRHKFSYAYVLTPAGLRGKARVTVAFLRRKQAEYVALEQEIAELRREVAGR